MDVAVIIFGHNKKLYEFSSGDINETIGRYQYVGTCAGRAMTLFLTRMQYGGPHEHKGPADFAGKNDLNDEDDEEVDEAAIEGEMAETSIPQIQHQQNYAHMRTAAYASPPVGNGAMPYHPRQHTPQPQMGSRPASRNHNPIPRPGSTLGQVTHAPNVPNGYAYMPNHGVYNPHAPHGLPGGPHPAPQHPPQPQPQYQPQYNVPQPMQHQYMQDQRRQSMPPYQNDRLQPQPHIKTDRHSPSPPQQHQEPERRNDSLQPQQPKPLGAKSRSIYTPIDDRGSLLAQGWGMSTTSAELRQQETIKQEINRSQSVDVASVQRTGMLTHAGPPPKPQRVFSQPQRAQSITSITGDGKRPRLKVQIPSEHSDEGGSAGTGSSPRQSGTGETPAKATDTSHSSGVVLPPPSPSASALLSAGAQGPPNPFARPLPPNNASNNNTNAYTNNNNIETPISALPSRFLQDGMLPSPSSFYPGWDFGRSGDSNMLPSPLNFQTPVQGTGPSFGGVSREEANGGIMITEADRKRKSPEGEERVGEGPGGPRAGPIQGGGGGKRIKAEM